MASPSLCAPPLMVAGGSTFLPPFTLRFPNSIRKINKQLAGAAAMLCANGRPSPRPGMKKVRKVTVPDKGKESANTIIESSGRKIEEKKLHAKKNGLLAHPILPPLHPLH